MKITYLLLLILFTTSSSFAQEVKFGKISKKELQEKFYPQDTSANAVVLYKKRKTFYEYNNSTGWTLVTEVHERIKLYNKDGFGSATKKIRLYTQGKDEQLTLKAYTYNLENNKIVKTKLGKDGIFREAISKYWNSKNFTMPNLKNGSIIEWKYTISSPYYSNINDVICQYNIPIKYIDVKIQIPDFFEFKHLSSRYYPIIVNESQVRKNYSTSSSTRQGLSGFSKTKTTTEHSNTSIDEKVYTATAKNIPALIEEPYVNNINNYRAKIKFEIAAYKPERAMHKYFNTTWKDVTKTIYESPYFGVQLNKKNHFKDDLASITDGITSANEKINAVFQFVKNKIKWNETNSKYTSTDIGGIKKAYKSGVGNSAEINLTLVAMLREAGLHANPILVSTRSHDIPLFPTKSGFNYVIAGVEVQNEVILLDATEKYSIPNVLPLRVLNWEGKLIRKDGSSNTIQLYPNKYNLEAVSLSTKIDPEGTLTGMMVTRNTNLNALQYRNNYNAYSKDEVMSKLETKYNGIEIEKLRINNKENLSKPIVETIVFSKENQADIIGNKIYISSLLFLTTNKNPFTLEERLYPIDYGSPWKDNLMISIEIPEGYTVESKPENISLELPDSIGTYTFKVEVANNKINVTSKTKINSALLGANYYAALKEFYKKTIEKQQEKIVLIKG